MPKKNMEESPHDSQNFRLRFSEDSSTRSSKESEVGNEEHDVIVISDSSSNCSSPRYNVEPILHLKKHSPQITKKYIKESSNSDSFSTLRERYRQWRINKKDSFINYDKQYKNVTNKHNTLYISDGTSSGSSEFSRKYISNSEKTSSNCSIRKDVCRGINQLHSKSLVERNVHNSATNSRNLKSSSKLNEDSPMTRTPISDLKRNFTRKDAKNILKNIKSTKLVYDSPRQEKQKDRSLEDDVMHPAISPTNRLRNHRIIDETSVDSESDIIQENTTNVYENNSNRICDEPSRDGDTNIDCPELSERKKIQISQWLRSNSPDLDDDSSDSNIPPTNTNGRNSGNSSLERLEQVYETPNNRGKVNHAPQSDKTIINPDCNEVIQSIQGRQTTIHNYVQRSKNNRLELRTTTKKSNNNNMFSTPTQKAPQNVNITDCADILDKLYGKSWREKADKLLPNSEPRKQPFLKQDRAVQTERKPLNRQKYVSNSESEDSDSSFKDLKLQGSRIKKSTKKNTKKRDSFIDYESSESGPDSLYLTALTNPRISINSEKPRSTHPTSALKAIAICDSDTEDECDRQTDNIRRRRLSFSEDESGDSSTSEFDPGDDVPLKSTKKDSAKSIKKVFKLNKKTESVHNNKKYEKYYTFLESLSESVPMLNAHPDAKKYRTNFKNNKESLCNYLYKLYNERVFDKKLPEDLSIEWNVRMRGTAGFCYNKKSIKALGGVTKSSRIVLSTKVLDTSDRLRDTLIHEMCHAAAWLINDVSDGHGPFWTGWANKAMKTFPELPQIRRCHDYKIKTKFTYKCVGCGYSIGRHSKSLDVERKRCGHCYGKFELLVNKTTKSGTVQVQTPKREISGFALYVKENYNTVKKERNIKHGEVMKILGQQFSAIKIAKKAE